MLYCFRGSRHHADLPSFPTRRSSDLSIPDGSTAPIGLRVVATASDADPSDPVDLALQPARTTLSRSAEPTAELPSRADLVCRLPLEKTNSLPARHVSVSLDRPAFVTS